MAKHKEIDFQKWEQLEDYGEKMKAALWAAGKAMQRWLDLADELMDDAQADESDMYRAVSVVHEVLLNKSKRLGLDGGEATAHATEHNHRPGGLDVLDGLDGLDQVDVKHFQKAE